MAIEFANSSFIFDANLSANYKFEDNLTDSSGDGRTLTGVGTVAYTTGLFGKAYTQSNSKNNYLYTSNSMDVDGGAITMGCWFKDVGTEYTATSARGLLSQVNTNTKTRYGILAQSSNIYFGRDGVGGGGTSGSVAVPWTSYMSNASFNNLILTYDTTNICGYINGEFLGQAPASGNGAGYAGSVTGFGVGIFQGWAGWDTTYSANGIYDDVFVENRAFSASEVASYYADSVYNYLVLPRRNRFLGSISKP